MSLVPISSFGKYLGIPTPAIDSIVNIANFALRRNFWKDGRTVEHLGLANMTVDQIWNFVENGRDT